MTISGDIALNKEFDLGSLVLSEKDIIDFAMAYDPLDFHLSQEAAAKSIFGTLVASGPHAFNWFYKNKWVPAFKDSVLAGLELNHWKMMKPVYPGKKTFCKVIISSLITNEEKKHRSVTWNFFLRNEKQELVQTLEMTVLHSLTPAS